MAGLRLYDLRFLLIAVVAAGLSALGLWISSAGGMAKVLGAALFAISGTVTCITLYDQITICLRWLPRRRTAI